MTGAVCMVCGESKSGRLSLAWHRLARSVDLLHLICSNLRNIGVEAVNVSRDRFHATNGEDFQTYLGLIDIRDGPIRRVKPHGYGTVGDYSTKSWFAVELEVPDSRRLPTAWAVPHPTTALIQEPHRFTWGVFTEPSDAEQEEPIALNLSGNDELTDAIAGLGRSGPRLRVEARPDDRCWIIAPDSMFRPSRRDWSCYERIASCLLSVGGIDS